MEFEQPAPPDPRLESYIGELVARKAAIEAELQAALARRDGGTEGGTSDYATPLYTGESLSQPTEAQYRRFVSRIGAILFEVEPDGVVLFVNEAITKATGYRADELQGKNWWSVMFPGEQPQLLDLYARLQAGDVTDYEIVLVGKNGQPVALELTTANLYGADGTLQRIIGFGIDITARKRIEESFRNSEERFRALFEAMTEGAALHDLVYDEAGTPIDYRIVDINPAYEVQTGIHRDAAIGQKASELYRRGEPPFFEAYKRVVATGQPVHFEAHIEGQDRYFDISAFRTGVGQFATVFEDITERKRAEELLHASVEQNRTILLTAMDGFCLNDVQGRILDVNDAYCLMSGYSRDELLTMCIQDVEAAETPEETRQHLQRFKHNISERFETRHRRKDGRIIDLEVSVRYMPELDRVASFLRDITERKRAEEALRQSEEQFSKVFQASPAPVSITTRAEGRYLEVNDSWLRLTEYRREEVIGHTSMEVGIWFDVDDRTQLLRRLDEQGNVQDMEIQFRTRSGKILDALLAVEQISLKGETCLLHVGLDISERKRAEAALRLSEAAEREQRMLAEALRDTAAALNSTLDFETVMNRILENVGRVVPHDSASIMLVEGNEARVVYRRGWSPEQQAAFGTYRFPLETISLHEMITTRAPLVIADTRSYPGWLNPQVRSYAAAPICIQDQVIGFLNLGSPETGFFADLRAERLKAFADQAAIAIENVRLYGELRLKAEELEKRVAERTADLVVANTRLRELDQLKSRFIADISHELRTPVTSMGLILYVMERVGPAQMTTYLDRLRHQYDRLRELVEEILDFQSLDEGDHAAEAPVRVDLNAIINHVIETHGIRAEVAGLTLIFTPVPDLPLVLGFDTKLTRAVTNLVINAITYTASGQVAIETFHEGRFVGLEVRDTGQGILPEDLPHVFEPFYRGKQVGSSNVSGTGLGLSIVKEIVDLHHGQVHVKSEVGVGSVFTIRLPCD